MKLLILLFLLVSSSLAQQAIKAHVGVVRDVDLAGKFFVTCGDDGFIKVWNLRGKRIWRLPSGKLFKELRGYEEYVRALAFSKYGRKLASGDDLWEIRVWDAYEWKLLRKLEGHSGWIYSVAFSPKGDILTSASKDGSVRLWYPDGRSAVLQGHRDYVYDISFSPDGPRLVSVGNDGHVIVWDVGKRKILKKFSAGQGTVYTVHYSPKGDLVATGGFDGSVKLWSTKSWRLGLYSGDIRGT